MEGTQKQALLDLIAKYNEAIANGEFKTPASDGTTTTSPDSTVQGDSGTTDSSTDTDTSSDTTSDDSTSGI